MMPDSALFTLELSSSGVPSFRKTTAMLSPPAGPGRFYANTTAMAGLMYRRGPGSELAGRGKMPEVQSCTAA